jgi:peptidoglycan/xylan/chitin deacetylase (PgdA/CDA1 family)
MYHEVPPDSRDVAYFAVPRKRFAAQLDQLAAAGKRGVTLEAILDAPAPPRNVVAVTLDDGHATHFTEAFPELARRGMTATFFVITARVGTPGYVTWAQLRELTAAGMSVQSHTHGHQLLSELPETAVIDELRTSRGLLDAELGQRTTTIALPGGEAPRLSFAVFRNTGYRWVATSLWGANQPVGSEGYVRRYTVRRDTNDHRFEICVNAASGPYSPEGLRLAALRGLRRAIGPSRYARWRRAALSTLGR